VDGFDDDTLSPLINLELGTVEASLGDAITGSQTFGLNVPTSFADAVSLAEDAYAGGEADFNEAATALASSDYVTATYFDAIGTDYVSIIPLEELFLGTVASF
jgi:hypothetical protein